MHLRFLFLLLSMLWFSDPTDATSGGDDDSGGGDDDATGDSGGDPSDPGDDDSGDDDGKGESKLESTLRKEREDRKKFQRELRDATRRLRELEGKDATETEKLTQAEQKAEQAETKLRAATGRTAVMDAANKRNATNLRAVYALVRDDLEFDDDGEPVNVDDVLDQLKDDEPDLFKHSKGRGDGGAGNDTPDTSDINAQIRRKAGRR